MRYKNVIGDEIRKMRDARGWTQEDLAAKLQLLGFDIERTHVGKIECRVIHVSDYEQLFLARVFGVLVDDLYPKPRQNEPLHEFVARKLERKRAPVRRGPRRHSDS